MNVKNTSKEQLAHEILDLRRQIETCNREVVAQKEYFENLIQYSAAPTFVLDRSHKVVLWNKACEKMTGIKATDIIGTDEQWKPFHKQKRPVLADVIIDDKTGDLSQLYPTHAKSKFIPGGLQAEGWYSIQGAERYLSFNATPIRNSAGELIAVVETLEDLTETQETQRKLRESEKRYRVLFEKSQAVMLVIDPESGEIVAANEAAISYYGYNRTELTGKSMTKIIALPTEHVLQMHREAMQKPQFVQLQNRLKSGKIRDVELSWGPITMNGKPYLFAIIHDITCRKVAEDAVQEGKSKLAAITSLTIDAVILIDNNGNVCYWNKAAEKMFGYNRSEMIGKSLENIIPVRFREAHRRALQKFAKTGDSVMVGRVYEISALHKDGSEFPIELSISGLLLKNKWHSAGVVRNITKRKNLEIQLRQAQKMESIGRLAGGIAHDYNNMLSAILGFSELALEKLDPTDPLHEDLNEIHKAGIRSMEITRQLLAFARKQTIDPIMLDLNKSVESMLKMLRRLIGENIDLAWLPQSNLWSIKIDPSQIDQILANLCVNSRDAIEGVGRITIETGTASFNAADCADHPGFVPGDYILLAVSDNGCGMDIETIDKIFEPFFTTKEVGQGTGLGLSTVYGIVKQNQGFINVYSEPGKGTTFKIYLSRHANPAVDISRESMAGIPQGHGEIILVVEDEGPILKLSKRILQNLGYTVLTAQSPNQALRLISERPIDIDLLITDVVMPEMNGKELSDKLHEIYPKLSTLFMSGYTASAIAHHGVLDEGVHFITKPFSKEKMAYKVKEALDLSGKSTTNNVQS